MCSRQLCMMCYCSISAVLIGVGVKSSKKGLKASGFVSGSVLQKGLGDNLRTHAGQCAANSKSPETILTT